MTPGFPCCPMLAALGSPQQHLKKEFDFVVWHLCNGYSVHTFPRFCWFRDYSNSILIKLYLIWVYLVVCLVWSVERCFGMWVSACAEKAFCWRPYLVKWQEVVSVDGPALGQISINLTLRERHERNVAKNCRLCLLRKLPVWVTYLLLLTFYPVTILDFPFFPSEN